MTNSIKDKIQALQDKQTANLKTGPNEISQNEANTLQTTWQNAEAAAYIAPQDAADC